MLLQNIHRLCIVRIMGGLGNQMFQYAAGRAVAMRCGVELLLDTNWFNNIPDTCTPREFQLDIFPIQAKKTTQYELHILQLWNFLRSTKKKFFQHSPVQSYNPIFFYQKDCCNFIDFAELSLPIYLDGYWQSIKYFKTYSKEIKKEFTFPPFQDDLIIDLKKRILTAQNSVSLHIRRGDYVHTSQVSKIHYIDYTQYYKNALEKLYNDCGMCTIFVFSDDTAWARTNLEDKRHTFFVVELPKTIAVPWHDMHLMSLCRHHIIANSSFSWWGAWLGKQNGVTIAPSRWFAEPTAYCSDIYCPSWIILDC